jgi:hypothetical protein
MAFKVLYHEDSLADLEGALGSGWRDGEFGEYYDSR